MGGVSSLAWLELPLEPPGKRESRTRKGRGCFSEGTIDVRCFVWVFATVIVMTGGMRADGGAPLPVFFSADKEHDRVLNDLFLRHLRIDVSDTSLKRAPGVPVPTYGTCTLWRDWEVENTLWYDATSANFPHEDRLACFRGQLETIPIDRFGYVFTAHNNPEPPLLGPQSYFGMGWPFPQYVSALGSKAAGWEFNASDPQGWSFENVDCAEVHDGYLHVRTSQAGPRLTSPAFSANWIHAPIVMIDVAYDELDDDATQAERVFTISWTTTDQPEFSSRRSVRSDRWPALPVAEISRGFARRLWFPMYLHPGWRGRTITRVAIGPLGGNGPRNLAMRINAMRLNYDTRHAVNNPIHVRAAARKFFWDGDAAWLERELPRMRKAMEFMLTHMKARELGVIDQSFFVGHDGLGWETPTKRRIGHGLGSNYFDITPMGPRDLQSAGLYLLALQAMAEIETYVEAHPKIDSPKPAVSTPDGRRTRTYGETSASLRALVEPARKAIHREFWNPRTGRYGGWRDVNGALKDYGYTHLNLEALAAGVPDESSARSILDWLDGRRIVSGDTSTGPDIYDWQFAARMSTKRNLLDYGWTHARYAEEGEPRDQYTQTVASLGIPFEGQVQDGGAVLFTTFFDVKGSFRYGDAPGAWRVWRRMLDHHAKVLKHGGKGSRFYRDYYEASPSRGVLQGGGPPGALGLDEEFVENLLVPTAWVSAWLGIAAPQPHLLEIAPTVPEALGRVGVRNVIYMGNRLDVRAEHGLIDLTGSDIVTPQAGMLRLCFRGDFPVEAVVFRDGKTDPGHCTRTDQGITLRTRLGPGRFEVKPVHATDPHITHQN